RVTGTSPVVAAPATAVDEKLAPSKAAPQIATIRDVTVVQGKNGLNIEIAANEPITPKVIKLTSPDRIVLDIAASRPLHKRERTIAVNTGDVKAIRIAQYALNPPATRIVIDLSAPQEFEIATNGTHARLALKANTAVAASTAPSSEKT